MRCCLDCDEDISLRYHNAKLCLPCGEKREIKRKEAYWVENKDRYQHRHIERLGNPDQDTEIMWFIKYKRLGIHKPEYKSLPNFIFKHNNHAFYPRYIEEIFWGDYN